VSAPAPQNSIRALVAAAAARLAAAGIETPELDARLLLQHVLGMSHTQVVMQGDEIVDDAGRHLFQAALARRLEREPVSRIVGRRGFWKSDFRLSAETLDPRPDSETLIEAALKYVVQPPAAVLDLGTGTGCLLLSLLQEWPQARGIGVDISPDAVDTARLNAQALKVEDRADFVTGDWAGYQPRQAGFDVVVSNPPYISAGEMTELAPEVALYDPLAALLGGEDGLEAYRSIISRLPQWLKKGGWALFEIGHKQGRPVRELLVKAGFDVIQTVPDLGGRDRVIVAKRH
jgi:release factor glutamine methyltransferase